MAAVSRPAPPPQACAWINTSLPVTLEALRGRIFTRHAFQMHSPACVELAMPQARRVHGIFTRDDVVVLGLHTVFERHDAATPKALEHYVQERRLTFAIGVDTPGGDNGIPITMKSCHLDGTLSVVLVDRAGRMRMKRLRHVPDLALGAAIGSLMHEAPDAPRRSD